MNHSQKAKQLIVGLTVTFMAIPIIVYLYVLFLGDYMKDEIGPRDRPATPSPTLSPNSK